MEISEVKQVLEAVLFVSDRALSLKELKNILQEDYPDTDNIENLLNELKAEYENSDKPYEIRFVAGGWIFASKPAFSPWIKKLLKEKTVLKLTPSSLETLAMVAYKQPITRAEVEEIRGVESAWVLDTLLERKLIKIVGRKEALGRPLLYGTTQEFLKHFGLANRSELPLIEGAEFDLNPEPEVVVDPELPFNGEQPAENTDENVPADTNAQEEVSETPVVETPAQESVGDNEEQDVPVENVPETPVSESQVTEPPQEDNQNDNSDN